MRVRSRAVRWASQAVGFVLIAVGLVGVWIPFTFHILGLLAVAGLIVVLRNSRTWKRRFILFQRRHPRWGVPIRRLLRRPPEIAPVFWHEALRTERWLVPPRLRRLRRWRRAAFARQRHA